MTKPISFTGDANTEDQVPATPFGPMPGVEVDSDLTDMPNACAAPGYIDETRFPATVPPVDEQFEASAIFRRVERHPNVARYEPLLAELLARGLARADPLGLGLVADDDGRLVGDAGPSELLWLAGPLRRAALWEATAVLELAEQVAALATALRDSVA